MRQYNSIEDGGFRKNSRIRKPSIREARFLNGQHIVSK